MPSVKRACVGQRCAGKGAIEIANIAGYDFLIQTQRVNALEQRISERLPKRVDQLFEGVTTGIGRVLGPQMCNDLIATHAALTRSGDYREERESSALMSTCGPASA